MVVRLYTLSLEAWVGIEKTNTIDRSSIRIRCTSTLIRPKLSSTGAADGSISFPHRRHSADLGIESWVQSPERPIDIGGFQAVEDGFLLSISLSWSSQPDLPVSAPSSHETSHPATTQARPFWTARKKLGVAVGLVAIIAAAGITVAVTRSQSSYPYSNCSVPVAYPSAVNSSCPAWWATNLSSNPYVVMNGTIYWLVEFTVNSAFSGSVSCRTNPNLIYSSPAHDANTGGFYSSDVVFGSLVPSPTLRLGSSDQQLLRVQMRVLPGATERGDFLFGLDCNGESSSGNSAISGIPPSSNQGLPSFYNSVYIWLPFEVQPINCYPNCY